MNEAASEADFEVQLRAEGYTEVEIKEYAPGAGHGRHRHHFAVKGLVLSGGFIVQQDDDLVPRFRSSHHSAACSFANFGIEGH